MYLFMENFMRITNNMVIHKKLPLNFPQIQSNQLFYFVIGLFIIIFPKIKERENVSIK